MPTKSTNVCLVCGNNDPFTSYFTFPSEETKRKSWLKICSLDDPSLYISPCARICSDHFIEDAFTKSLNETVWKRRLKKGAIPTLNVKSNFSKLRSNPLLKTSILGGTALSCFICGYSQYSDARSFHKFPTNIEVRKVWLQNLDMRDVPLSAVENKRLCSIHFSWDDIVIQPMSGKHGLRPKAVPLIVRNNRGSKYVCERTFIRPIDTLNSNEQNCEENNNRSKSTSTVKIYDDENVDASLRSFSSLPNNHSMAKSDVSESEDVIICEELSSTPIIYISDDENTTSRVSTHNREVAKSSQWDISSKSKSSSSFKLKSSSTKNDPSNSPVIYVLDEEDNVTDIVGGNVSEICTKIKQQITSDVSEIPTSTTPSPQQENNDEPHCPNVISTTELNEVEITKNNQSIGATISGKNRRRNQHKMKRNLLLKQKLNDYQKLFDELLKKDLITDRGKRLINKIRAKHSARNQKPSKCEP